LGDGPLPQSPSGPASYVKMEIKERDMTEEEIERIVRRQA
jgi:hypothetical protein